MGEPNLDVRIFNGPRSSANSELHDKRSQAIMAENESRDEESPEDNTRLESIEEADRRNFELASGDESEGSGGFRMDGPAADPYVDETENEEEGDVKTSSSK